MGCSDDKSIKVDNEETNQIQNDDDDEDDSSIEKDFPDFEEYNSNYISNINFFIKMVM